MEARDSSNPTRSMRALWVVCVSAAVLTIAVMRHEARAETGTARVAVAANFIGAARLLATKFAADSGQSVALSSGATGQLYAQILQGAPFDVLLAADTARPAALVARGRAVQGSAFTYAQGTLVLVERSPATAAPGPRPQMLAKHLAALALMPRALAMANPNTAPYGRAARQALRHAGIKEVAAIVQGINIAQTFQFVAQGLTRAGLVARSQALLLDQGWHVTPIPPRWHTPISQDAVLLARGQHNPGAVAFLAFLRTPAAAAIITQSGYAVPPATPAR